MIPKVTVYSDVMYEQPSSHCSFLCTKLSTPPFSIWNWRLFFAAQHTQLSWELRLRCSLLVCWRDWGGLHLLYLLAVCCWITWFISSWKINNFDVKWRFMYQNRPSKLHQLPFDQGVQIVIPPRSPASVPELIGTPSDGILHRSEWPGFVVYYVNT